MLLKTICGHKARLQESAWRLSDKPEAGIFDLVHKWCNNKKHCHKCTLLLSCKQVVGHKVLGGDTNNKKQTSGRENVSPRKVCAPSTVNPGGLVFPQQVYVAQRRQRPADRRADPWVWPLLWHPSQRRAWFKNTGDLCVTKEDLEI